MILINKYEAALSIDEVFVQCKHQHDELVKILDFIDLPPNIKELEKQNSTILRNYYSNALSHNLLDIKTVKYIVNRNITPNGLSERSIYQQQKAEDFLNSKLYEPISLSLIYQLQKILIAELYNRNGESTLFNGNNFKQPEKLCAESEMELDSLCEFLNSDNEFHPIIQSWMLLFKILGLPMFSEGKSKIASLMQNFWLKKHGMDLQGLLSIEHDLYLNKNDYQKFFYENRRRDLAPNEDAYSLNDQISFGLNLHSAQLSRIYNLLQTYFRKQVDFDKLKPRQKNIMNYVFKRGYRLKEIDESILNKRQKLIMYIIQHRGFVSTKELVSEFECNRKTIQRDFTYLLDTKLVKVIGQGSALRYALNLNENNESSLNDYQSEYLKSTDEIPQIDFE